MAFQGENPLVWLSKTWNEIFFSEETWIKNKRYIIFISHSTERIFDMLMKTALNLISFKKTFFSGDVQPFDERDTSWILNNEIILIIMHFWLLKIF